MSAPFKIQTCDPALSDAEARAQGRITLGQEETITRILSEPTKSALVADEVGQGKTLISSEVILRAGWERVLIIALPDTFGQWAERISLQSDGRIELRPMNTSKPGTENYRAFMAGEAGVYAAGIAWLTQKDFGYQDKWQIEQVGTERIKRPVFKIDKKTNEWKLQARKRGTIGPEMEPARVRERKHLFTLRKMKAPLDAVIFDEAHAVANHKSVQRVTLLTLAPEWKIAMSATWSGNSFEHAWSIPRWLWPDRPDIIPAYWDWREMWCRVETTLDEEGKPVYVRGELMKHVAGEKDPAGTFVRTLPLYLRSESQDRVPDPHVVLCDPTPQQAAQYEELQRDLMTWVTNWEGDEEPLVVDMPGSLYSRLRQVALAELSFAPDGSVTIADDAASAKLGPLRGLVDSRYAGQQVGILTDSKVYAKFVAARMQAAGYSAIAYTGDTSKKERERIKAAFIAGEYQYLVGTVQSMGTGLDGLQRVCNKVIRLSLPDGNPSLEVQSVGRFFRTGRTLANGGFELVDIQVRGFEVDKASAQRLIAKAWAMRSSIGRDALVGSRD